MSLKTGIKCILRYWAWITYLSKIDIQELFDPIAFLTFPYWNKQKLHDCILKINVDF